MMPLLIQHIRKFISLTDATAQDITSRFTVVAAGKKQHLVTEGQIVKELYFVERGCLRMFFTDEKGVEQTLQFALENWWMTDLDAFHKRSKAVFSIQAIEPAVVNAIAKPAFDQLLVDYPLLEKYFRLIYERAYAASLFRIKYFRLPKDEFYELFSSKYPEFIQRLPQKMLASFLGFTPEYLSELRKKKSLQKK